jgi:hypothetical protein
MQLPLHSIVLYRSTSCSRPTYYTDLLLVPYTTRLLLLIFSLPAASLLLISYCFSFSFHTHTASPVSPAAPAPTYATPCFNLRCFWCSDAALYRGGVSKMPTLMKNEFFLESGYHKKLCCAVKNIYTLVLQVR